MRSLPLVGMTGALYRTHLAIGSMAQRVFIGDLAIPTSGRDAKVLIINDKIIKINYALIQTCS